MCFVTCQAGYKFKRRLKVAGPRVPRRTETLLAAQGPLATLAMASVWVKRELDSVALTISHRNLCWYALEAIAVHYPRTMPDQPAYTGNGRTLNIEISRKMAGLVVSLPLYPDMSNEQQDYVIEQVMQYFA